METLFPASYTTNSSWLMQGTKSKWTREENKTFESALAIFDKETPDRWENVASMIPGKSVVDVINRYRELVADISDIEAGLVPIPRYLTSFTFEWTDSSGFDVFGKRPFAGRPVQEKKKGVPWTEDEHVRFLLGLQKHGKGDWRNISRNFVRSKTPTQVASHAQKYFLRQKSEVKDKRRPSIHDITTVHLSETPPSENGKFSPVDTPIEQKSSGIPKSLLDWNQSDNGSLMAFGSTNGNTLIEYPYEVASIDAQLQRAAHLGDYIGVHDSNSLSLKGIPSLWMRQELL